MLLLDDVILIVSLQSKTLYKEIRQIVNMFELQLNVLSGQWNMAVYINKSTDDIEMASVKCLLHT